MSKFLKLVALAACLSFLSESAPAGQYNLGREATKDEIAAWDIDVRRTDKACRKAREPLRRGKKSGQKSVPFATVILARELTVGRSSPGGSGSLATDNPVKTVGSYWPYLSTVFDYVNRAMPFTEARSLKPDEVYALTAYILFINDIVSEEDFELSKATFLDKRLPNEANFFTDPRPDTPLVSQEKPCMENCKPDVKIPGRARVLDVTPESSAAN